MMAIFITPIVSLFAWHFFVRPIHHAIPGPLNKTVGIVGASIVIFSFAWQWTTSRYLFDLLQSKENNDYEQYRGFIVVMLIIGLLWSLLFWTNYIGLIAYIVTYHTWVLIPLFLVIIATIYYLRGALSFRFKACEALLKEVPYHSIKARFFSDIFGRHWSFPQQAIHQVYLKYGDKRLA